jgi:glycosyltransferase involved in cell wall biosynthesis
LPEIRNKSCDVDVVIPVRDGARFLPDCLDSVIAQTYPPRAIIVVDDGSTDATPQVLAEYAQRRPSLQIIRSEPHGVSHARNLALSACRASFVAFLDADDMWEPSKLERQMALFVDDRPRLGFVHCAYRLMDEDGQSVVSERIVEPRKRGCIFSELLACGNIVSGSGSAVIVRRKLLDLVGGFDERLFFGEDWDLWIRLASVSEIDFVPERLVAIRVHDGSAQRRRRPQKAELTFYQNLLILDRWYGTDKFSEGARKRCRRDAVKAAQMRPNPHIFKLAGDWRFYLKLRRCDSCLGRALFSGPLDFFCAMFAQRSRALLRAALTWVPASVLEALQDFRRRRMARQE